MPDLKDQIRSYYEATTEPVDVDAITVDPGTVLVGPFPDAAQRRSVMRTITPEKPPTTPAWKGWAAAAAAALIVVVAGVALLLATRGGDEIAPATTPSTETTETTQASPIGPVTVEEALAVADEYWAAYDAGDFATIGTLLSADVIIRGPFNVTPAEHLVWIEQLRAWAIAQESTLSPRECDARERGDGTVRVRCSYEDLPALHQSVGAPPVEMRHNLDIGADGIRGWFIARGAQTYDSVTYPFSYWIEEHHPDVAPDLDRTVPFVNARSIEEAEEFGRIRAEYAEEWAAYLEANGCTYEDWLC